MNADATLSPTILKRGSTDRRPCVLAYHNVMTFGGVARVIVNLLPGLRAEGFRPVLALNQAEGGLLQFLDPEIEVISLGSGSSTAALPKLARILKKLKPEILFAQTFRNGVVGTLARKLSGTDTKVVACLHNMLSEVSKPGAILGGRIAPLACRLVMPMTDAVVAVSQGVADDFARMARIDRARIRVIHNPVITPDFALKAAAPLDHPWFAQGEPPVVVAVGRLAPQKDFGMLLEAFALLRRRRPCRLVLIGDGPERAALEAKAKGSEAAADMALVGFRDNPFPYVRAAGLFALSSRFEGLPTVLIEALGCGTPVVATDCPGGPAEITEGERYGRLVPVGDPAAMAAAMDQVLGAPRDSDRLLKRAQDFSVAAASRNYAALFSEVLSVR